MGSVGDSYDNALAETIHGLYEAGVVDPNGTWASFEEVEFAILEWVGWFNRQKLLEPIGNSKAELAGGRDQRQTLVNDVGRPSQGTL